MVDHGFWTPGDRARWHLAAADAGATSVLVYLEASHEELWERVSKRNAQHEADPNSIYFSESDLTRYRARFVPPQPDEPHLIYRGDPGPLLKALAEAAQGDLANLRALGQEKPGFLPGQHAVASLEAPVSGRKPGFHVPLASR
ncbi:ATP-binding protein [Streptomyces sp. NBC_00335]|uniref:AAA family ATPase n=1 Tax=unclassified Streptomyces TaxID=2593676 RepID=UPI0022558940|nr:MULTISPECIES: AAA family ATPase [unclassified Streptomyces]MCX5406273.1 ATP-binding protein [Streptomyces sp. NBC_00086]